jgi:vacuolar-type H+-ATPase subunit I/STV1
VKGGFLLSWKRIKAEYIAGGISLQKLAEKYDVSFSTIQKKSMEEKWGNLRKKNRRKVEEKIIDSVSSKEAKKAVDIIDVADKLLDKIEELADTLVVDTQSLKQLTSALKDLKEIKGYKSEADMREQEARIAKLRKEAEDETPEDREVNVIFDGDIEKYSK